MNFAHYVTPGTRPMMRQPRHVGPRPYQAPKNAPGVTDLASAVTYANTHGNATAGPAGAPAPGKGDTTDPNDYGAPGLTHTIETTQAPDGTTTKTTTTGAPPPPPGADPRDAAYWQAYSENHAKATQAINQLNLTDSQELGNMNEAIRQLIERHPDDVASVNNSENAAGGYFTGHRNTQQGNLERDYLERQAGLHSTYDQAHAARLLNVQGIQAQEPIDDNQALLDAISRALANPANAGTTGTAAAATTSSTGKPAAKKKSYPESPMHKMIRLALANQHS